MFFVHAIWLSAIEGEMTFIKKYLILYSDKLKVTPDHRILYQLPPFRQRVSFLTNADFTESSVSKLNLAFLFFSSHAKQNRVISVRKTTGSVPVSFLSLKREEQGGLSEKNKTD